MIANEVSDLKMSKTLNWNFSCVSIQTLITYKVYIFQRKQYSQASRMAIRVSRFSQCLKRLWQKSTAKQMPVFCTVIVQNERCYLRHRKPFSPLFYYYCQLLKLFSAQAKILSLHENCNKRFEWLKGKKIFYPLLILRLVHHKAREKTNWNVFSNFVSFTIFPFNLLKTKRLPTVTGQNK